MTLSIKNKSILKQNSKTFSLANAINNGLRCFFTTMPTGLETLTIDELHERVELPKEFVEAKRGKVLFATKPQDATKVFFSVEKSRHIAFMTGFYCISNKTVCLGKRFKVC